VVVFWLGSVVQVVVVSFASTPDLFSILGLPERHSFLSVL